jgi:hypothetical protein
MNTTRTMESNQNLLNLIEELQEKVKYLEEENIENTNLIYQLMNSIEAVDRRIDIIADELRN